MLRVHTLILLLRIGKTALLVAAIEEEAEDAHLESEERSSSRRRTGAANAANAASKESIKAAQAPK